MSDSRLHAMVDAMARVYCAAIDLPGKGLADLADPERMVALSMARAGLAAIREPDPAMLDAVAPWIGDDEAGQAWTAMVDALLAQSVG